MKSVWDADIQSWEKWSIASQCFYLLKNVTCDIISRPQMNVSTALATSYATLHIGPKISVNLVPAIYTSLPRALEFEMSENVKNVCFLYYFLM